MTKDELENELAGTKAMLEATEKERDQYQTELRQMQFNFEEAVKPLSEFFSRVAFTLSHGGQMDYDLRTIKWDPKQSCYIVQNHRQLGYVEGRGVIPAEKLTPDGPTAFADAFSDFFNGF